MTRGIGDPAPTPEDNGQDQNSSEIDAVINELIKGQNKLHDRLVDLERKLDHVIAVFPETAAPKRVWKRGL